MAPKPPNGEPSGRRSVEGSFDDIDAMAASPLAWDQKYEQIGRGRFQPRDCALGLPRSPSTSVDPRPVRRPLKLEERLSEQLDTDVVEERGEPLLLPFPRDLPYAFQRL